VGVPFLFLYFWFVYLFGGNGIGCSPGGLRMCSISCYGRFTAERHLTWCDCSLATTSDGNATVETAFEGRRQLNLFWICSQCTVQTDCGCVRSASATVKLRRVVDGWLQSWHISRGDAPPTQILPTGSVAFLTVGTAFESRHHQLY
jgi:hypothetical protein